MAKGISTGIPMQYTTAKSSDTYMELGTPGLEIWSGYIQEAYDTRLYFPQVQELYNRIWRSDPETTMVRHIFNSLAGELKIYWELPEEIGNVELGAPNDTDKRALDFAFSVGEEIEGGLDRWLKSCLERVPFWGFGWWEAPLGLRLKAWHPPNKHDNWMSNQNDGLVGYRRLAFRRYDSFYRWESDDETGRVYGFVQWDFPNPYIIIPSEKSLHITFGDTDNPEGLAPLESLWRLERIKYALEVIQGIGFEHSAGHSVFQSDKPLTEADKANIRAAAKAVMTAKEGNYVALPGHVDYELQDVPFQSAGSLLQAIRYYGILKLAVFGMQFIAISTMTGSGSFAALKDSSSTALLLFNSLATDFVQQADEQIGKRLFNIPQNKAAFSGMSRRPRMRVHPVEREVNLRDLSDFSMAMEVVRNMSEDDELAFRKQSRFLSQSIPEDMGRQISTDNELDNLYDDEKMDMKEEMDEDN